MNNRIENIIIVGSGLSGWLSALFLDKFLNSAEKICSISIIESEETGATVFEDSTIPNFLKFLQILGVYEYDFIVNCDVTFKLGTKFINWSGGGKSDIFWHPFPGPGPVVGDFPLIDWWLKKKISGKDFRVNADYYSSINPYLADSNLGPKLFKEKRNFYGEVPYAFNMNSAMAAKYLSRIGKQRGIKTITDNIIHVKVNTQGFITQLQTKKSGAVTGDLFIDCSGFNGLLINKNLKEPFVGYTESLFCDNAVVVKFPRESAEKKIFPYQTSTALSSGWLWHIPLFSCKSYGYVYSGAHITKEKAQKELLDYLGKKAGEVETKHIKMRVGRTKNPWKKNCVSIGTSAGFVDPLESTGIQLIENGLWGLLFNFPDKSFNPVLIKNYNNFVLSRQQHILDFIVLHYCISKREDTKFWKETKIKLKIPDTLKDDLELLDKILFDFRTKSSYFTRLFSRESYFYILAGLKHLPKSNWTLLNYKNLENLAEQVRLKTIINNPLYKTLPDHFYYLSSLNKNFKKLLLEP